MCPARLILLPPGSRERLTGERIAQVYASPAAEEVAGELAEELGVRLTIVPVLRTEAEAVVRDIADLHRGETVVVIAPDLELGLTLPAVIEHEGGGWIVAPSPVQTPSAGPSPAGSSPAGVPPAGVPPAGLGAVGASPNEVTLATYERAAERFRETIPRGANGALIELFDLIDSHLRDGGSILEIGSGTGRDAVELERRGHRVRRTDAPSSFVEMIRSDGYQVDQLNALTDDFGGPYDLVFADAVFLHFTPEQLATVLRKAHAAAEFLAFTTRQGDGDEWSTRHLDLPRHFTMWQEEPLRELLAECGWKVLAWQRQESKISGWFYVLARRQVTPAEDAG